MSIFDSLFGSQESAVLRAQRASLMEQLRQAGSVAASAATRGATSPGALTQSVARAQQGTRAANAGQHAQQLVAARGADQQQAGRLLGGALGAGSSLLAMMIPGAQAAAPVLGAAGGMLGKTIGDAASGAIGSGPLPPQEQGFVPGEAGSIPGTAHMSFMPQPPPGGMTMPGLGQALPPASGAPSPTQTPSPYGPGMNAATGQLPAMSPQEILRRLMAVGFGQLGQ